MKISAVTPLSAMCFSLGYLQALTGEQHPAWFILAVVITAFAIGFSQEEK